MTAGTIFDGTRTPLTVWFQAAWQMTVQKNGISALGLQRVLGLGSYQTAWAMLHRYQRAMIRPGRERLAGIVEVDETLVGGLTPGRKGRAIGAKALVVVAVEQRDRSFGRCRLELVGDVGAVTLGQFMVDNIVEGSTVITDGWQGYRSATKDYTHQRVVVTGADTSALLPGVHRVASLLKRWLLGTHQGGIATTHLQDYLDEFTFRFNRRTSRARGLLFFRLLEQATEHAPVRYRDLVVNPAIGNPRASHPVGPRSQPGTLAPPAADRPWCRLEPEQANCTEMESPPSLIHAVICAEVTIARDGQRMPVLAWMRRVGGWLGWCASTKGLLSWDDCDVRSHSLTNNRRHFLCSQYRAPSTVPTRALIMTG